MAVQIVVEAAVALHFVAVPVQAVDAAVVAGLGWRMKYLMPSHFDQALLLRFFLLPFEPFFGLFVFRKSAYFLYCNVSKVQTWTSASHWLFPHMYLKYSSPSAHYY